MATLLSSTNQNAEPGAFRCSTPSGNPCTYGLVLQGKRVLEGMWCRVVVRVVVRMLEVPKSSECM